MRKIRYSILATGLFLSSTCGVSTVMAKEYSTKEQRLVDVTKTYELKSNNMSSLKKTIKNVFDENLDSLKLKNETDSKLVFETKEHKVTVTGFDKDSYDTQNVIFSLENKRDIPLHETRTDIKMPNSMKLDSKVKFAKLSIQDKEAPTIFAEEEYTTEVNVPLDLESMISSKDNSGDSKLSLESNVDYSKPGNYSVKVTAKDKKGNLATKEIQVKVEADFYQKIADAALAQLGVYQDCTMLVTNSLKAVGINFHGAPSAYLSLGPLTDTPVPGDICVYQGHVAIYIGNGQAVHGGWCGNQTVVSSVSCTNSFIGYVHVQR